MNEPPETEESLAALRARVAALHAAPCAMAHEAIPSGPDGRPARSSQTQSGYARPGICPPERRAAHIGCSHTTARYLLGKALKRLAGADAETLDALRALENDISLLDHRRFAAEIRRADAILAGMPEAAACAEADIAAAIAEHRACSARAITLRDDVLRCLDAALAGARRDGL